MSTTTPLYGPSQRNALQKEIAEAIYGFKSEDAEACIGVAGEVMRTIADVIDTANRLDQELIAAGVKMAQTVAERDAAIAEQRRAVAERNIDILKIDAMAADLVASCELRARLAAANAHAKHLAEGRDHAVACTAKLQAEVTKAGHAAAEDRRLREKLHDAIMRGGLDLSPCGICSALVACILVCFAVLAILLLGIR